MEKKLSESQLAFATALSEGNEMHHLHAGGDHAFLALLGMRYSSASGVLFRYEYLEAEAREIVRKQTPKWFFRKNGKVRLATSSDDLMVVKAALVDDSTALEVLEMLLVVNAQNFSELLRKLKISHADLLDEVAQAQSLRAGN
jgi:hypothetical protein